MKTAKIFKSGNNQAVRIPKEFKLEGTEVEIERRGQHIGLTASQEVLDRTSAELKAFYP